MSRWLRRFGSEPVAPIARLVCFPHGGGGASAYRAWRRAVPGCIDVVAVQPPGREDRIGEAPCRRMDDIVAGTVDALATEDPLPTSLFGNSLGALVAYEVAHALASEPIVLAVAAATPPRDGLPTSRMCTASDDELRTWLFGRSGLRGPPELLAEVVLPVVRADLAVLSAYRPLRHALLSCPLLTLAGLGDADAPPDGVQGWSARTTGAVRHETLPGDHMFVADHRATVAAAVGDLILGELLLAEAKQ